MYLYEDVLIDNVNSLFTNSKVSALIAGSLDEALRRAAAKNEDSISLPLIALTGGDWVINDVNFYTLKHGNKIKRRFENIAKNVTAIPITIPYEMYVVASSSKECDMLTRELIFYYYMNPTLTVNLPYNINQASYILI